VLLRAVAVTAGFSSWWSFSILHVCALLISPVVIVKSGNPAIDGEVVYVIVTGDVFCECFDYMHACAGISLQ
jgi:hypothetical protein